MKYEFHHIGIPTTEVKPNEYYAKKFDLWSADFEGTVVRGQWHRFGPKHTLHPLIEKFPHIAFRVEDLEKALEGKEIIMEIYEPIPGYKVAMINDGGVPVEFVQTDMTYEELISKALAGESLARDL